MKFRAALTALAVLSGVAAAATVFAASASAHNTPINGVIGCATDGTYTVENDWPTSVDVTESGSTGGGTVTGLPVTIAASPGGSVPNSTATFTQTGIPGTVSQASVTIHSVWSDGSTIGDPNYTARFFQTCLAAPAAPTLTDTHCTGTVGSASYTIPASPSVSYFVNNSSSATTAGTYPLTPGASVHITATIANGNTIAPGATTSWDLTATTTDCTKTPATPATPTFTDTSCNGPGLAVTASVTIPASTGVDYYLNGSKTAAGTYPVAQGSTAAVTVQAQTGFVLNGTATWSFTATTRGCGATATPIAPSYTEAACISGQSSTGPTIAITSVSGVDYLVNGVAVTGPVAVTAGEKVTVTAVAESGYTLAAYPAGGWTHIYVAAPVCTAAVVAAALATSLPSTGSPDLLLAATAGGLLLLGTGLMMISRRR